VAYRWHAHSDLSALPVQAIFLGLALSTYAQCLFGRDSTSALTRYRVMPLRGWELLLAKGAAFLAVLLFLVMPLNVGAGLTFGLVAVAFGRYPSLVLRRPQHRWRFTGGDIRFSILQIAVGSGLAIGEYRYGPWFFAIAFGAYAVSLYAGALYWDKHSAAPARH
jgi:hypothetical protein